MTRDQIARCIDAGLATYTNREHKKQDEAYEKLDTFQGLLFDGNEEQIERTIAMARHTINTSRAVVDALERFVKEFKDIVYSMEDEDGNN